MNRWFWALPLLLVATGIASANYILIVVNLGEHTDLTADGNERPGGGAGALGALGGQVGGQVGQIGQPGGQLGLRGGQAGVQGGGAFRGGAGAKGGTAPPAAEAIFDPDAVPLHIVAIVEYQPLNLQKLRLFEMGGFLPIQHKWGKSYLLGKGKIHTASLIKVDKLNLKSLKLRFADRFDPKRPDTNPKKPSEKLTAEQLFEIAEWALSHGMVGKEDRFAQVMDQLAVVDPKHMAVGPYLKVKASLGKGLTSPNVAAVLKGKLTGSFKTAESPHYVLFHDLSTTGGEPAEIRSRLDRLEEAYKAFYYWFAFKGANPQPEMPREKLVAVLTSNEKEFARLYDQLMAGQMVAGVAGEGPREGGPLGGLGARAFHPLVVSDGFFGRRDNIVVFSSKRLDEQYDALEKHSQTYWQSGYNRLEIFKGKGAGMPRNITEDEAAAAQSLALVYKAMEDDSELSSTSHDATRQLLYASGLLPRFVIVPEWAEFGMGSVFETSSGSPWPTIGTVNYQYLTRFKAMSKKGKLERNPLETMRAIVTDGYFRQIQNGSDKPAALRKARATAWSLTYYLAQKKLDGLLRYFKELRGLPRDMELNEEVLLGCFARAFDCVDAAKKVDKGKLNTLANNWNLFNETTEVEPEMQVVQKLVETKVRDVGKSQDGEKNPSGAGKSFIGVPRPN